MITTGKCPKCEERLLNVKIEPIDLIEGLSTKWKGASYICPRCQTILGVEMDPTALRSAIVGDVKKLLGRG